MILGDRFQTWVMGQTSRVIQQLLKLAPSEAGRLGDDGAEERVPLEKCHEKIIFVPLDRFCFPRRMFYDGLCCG